MAKVNIETRLAIEKGLNEKKTYREIAQTLGISKSTIGYEIKQYATKSKNYNAELANWRSQQRAHAKNKTRLKVLNQELLQIVDKEIRKRRSPKDISLCLKKRFPEQKHLQISHETIYRLAYGYQKIPHHVCCDWHAYLPQKRKKRVFRANLRQSKKRRHPRSIHAARPDLLKSFGVWQVDIMYIKNAYIFVAVETLSKKVMAQLVYDLKAERIQEACRFLFARVEHIKAIICDRGGENSGFKDSQRMLHTVIYSCDPHSPWQKGLVEQTNGILRKYLSRKTDVRSISQKDVYKYAARPVCQAGRQAGRPLFVLI